MRIVIQLSDGCLIENVLYSADDDPGLSVIIQDADVEGLEDDEVTTIDGQEYSVHKFEPTNDKKIVNEVFEMMKEE
jgi:hypothetical protein